jgi:predicted amidohydrolase
MKESLTIISLQPPLVRNDFHSAVKNITGLLKGQEGFDVLILPEYWNSLSENNKVMEFAGKSLEFLAGLSSKQKAFTIAAHLVCQDESIYNRCHVFDPKGELAGCYDKIHPFGYERERGIKAGSREFIFNLSGWKASCKICSDLWHTRDFIPLMESEVDILFVPVFTVVPGQDYTSYGKHLWYNLAVTRAKEGCMAVCISDFAAGGITENLFTAGATCLVDPSVRFKNSESPYNTILSAINVGNGHQNGKPGIVKKTISLENIRFHRSYRKNMGLF